MTDAGVVMKVYKKFFFLLTVMLCQCYDPVNPFLDINESDVSIVNSSVKDGDTLSIFSRESIFVAPVLREHISKYTVSIDSNRLWRPGADSTIVSDSLDAEARKFCFSFNYVGKKLITVSGLRNDGREVSHQISLFVKSPLEQMDISARAGDIIYLSTPPVKDPVIYVWDLKNGEVVKSQFHSVAYKLEKPFVASQGELYVTDIADSTRRSPPFLFSLADPQNPFLKYSVTSSNVISDTIKTVDSYYKLIVKLSGTRSIKSATVNGLDFKLEKSDSLGIEFSRHISLPDTGTGGAVALHIEFVDGLGRELSDIIYIQLVDKILSVLEPADFSIVHDSVLHIYGITGSSVAGFVFATINGDSIPVAGKLENSVWSFKLKLVPGTNTIKIELHPDSTRSGLSLAHVVHTVQYLPAIMFTSINDSVSGDTVFTGNTFFDFRILVTAPFQIRNATINNQPFDNVSSQGVNTFRLIKYLSGIDPLKGVLPAEIEITSESGQKFQHTFYLVYDKNVLSNLLSLEILSPVDDTVFTSESILRIFGTIGNYRQYGDLYLFSNVNGVYAPLYSIPGADSSWNLRAGLTEGWNRVVISVFEDSLRSGISLQHDSIHIRMHPSFSDTVKPVFVTVQRTGQNTPLKNFTCDTNVLDLKIIVSDNIGVGSVSVNNTITATSSDSVHFFCSVPLIHSSSGNVIVIRAIDRTGNTDSVTYNIKYNRDPFFVALPESRVLSVDTAYQFKVVAADPDGDMPAMTVKIDKSVKDTIISIAPNGTFSWTPAVSDTGRRIFTYVVTDGEGEKISTVSMVVVLSEAQNIPVAWKTKPEEIKTSFIAGIDTVNLLLDLDSITGKKPFNFSAVIGDSNVAITPEGAFSARIIWVPDSGDIGLKTLSVSVTDSAGYSDVLAVTLKVASPSPLTLSWKPTTGSFLEKDEVRMIVAVLSEPAPSQISVSCIIDWSQTFTGRTDITIPDTSYLTFVPGALSCSLKIRINDDDEVESDEQFVIQFDSMPSYVRPSIGGKFTGTIIDDDKISFSFLTSGVTGSESSGRQLIPISLSGPSLEDVVIDCAVNIASSAKEADFKVDTRRIVIPAGMVAANVEITLLNDNIIENDETIVLDLSSKQAKLVPGAITRFTYSIIDDDSARSEVYFSAPGKLTVNEGNAGGTFLIVNLSEQLGVPLTVYYTVQPGADATEGSDFTLTPSDSIQFNPGEVTKTITVLPIDNTRFERDESFILELTGVSNPLAATIGTSNIKEIVIIDNDSFFIYPGINAGNN